MMSVHEDNYDLVSIGAYKSGTNPELDDAIAHMKGIDSFLCQRVDEKMEYNDTVALMAKAVE